MSGANFQQDFITGFREGNFCSIREVYNQQYATLHTYVQQVIFDKAETDTIVADSFIKLIRRRAWFDSKVNIKAFLYITARNTCLQYIQFAQNKNHPHNEYIANNKESEQPIGGDELDEAIVCRFYEITSQLPAPAKEIFHLHYGKGAPVTNIAGQLDLNPGRVVQQIAGILRFLLHATKRKYTFAPLFLVYFLAVIVPGKIESGVSNTNPLY